MTYEYNNHMIEVRSYQETYDIETDEKLEFYAILVDEEYVDHGYVTEADAQSAAEDFIDGDLQSL